MGSGYQSAGLKRRQLARKMRWYIGLFVGALICISLIFIVVHSGFFTVKKFELAGAPEDQKERILAVLRPQVIAGFWGSILGADNYFAWSDSLIYEDVRSNRVSVDRQFWSRHVRIIIHPRERYGTWCLISPEGTPRCTWVDALGVAFEPAPTPDGQLIISITESATTTAALLLGAPVIKHEYFEVIKRVAESVSFLELPILAIMVNRELEEVQLYTISGTKISFSLRFDPTISALPALKKIIESPGITNMRTIDFTVENRVFYTAK